MTFIKLPCYTVKVCNTVFVGSLHLEEPLQKLDLGAEGTGKTTSVQSLKHLQVIQFIVTPVTTNCGFQFFYLNMQVLYIF